MAIVVKTGVTVTVIVAELLMLPDAAVITAEPAATPVTSPLLLTVATLVAFDDQLIVAAIALPFWSFGDAVSCSVEPAATEPAPVTPMVESTGVGVGVGDAGGGDVGALSVVPPEHPRTTATNAATKRDWRTVDM